MLVVNVHFQGGVSNLTMNYSHPRISTLARRPITLSLFALAIQPLLLASFVSAATPMQHAFRIQDQWNVGGTGGWSHLVLDAPAHRLYISRANRIMVVDTETGKVVGEVEGLTSARGIALDGAGKFGYVTDLTDGTAGFVRVFDRSSLKLVASIPTGVDPDAIVFAPASNMILAFNTRGHSVTLIDTATNQVAATIPLPGRPAQAVVDSDSTVFVTIPSLALLVRMDPARKKITASFPLASCTGPSGLAIDTAQRQLLTTCEDHKLVAINADTGHVYDIGQVPAGTGDIDFVPKLNLLFVAGIDGTLSILHRESPNRYVRFQQIKTLPGARTMITSHQTSKAYLVTSKYGQNTAATSEELRFRPTPVPGTFSVIVVGR
jgi:YVTN family beta-propeller protein